MKRSLCTAAIVLMLAAPACAPGAAPAPSPIAAATAPPSPGPTTSPSPTATPVPPTPTASLTPTQPPSPTATPAPTRPTLSQSGPWGVIAAQDGLWAINPDGSGLRRVHGQTLGPPDTWQVVAAPAGGHVALVTFKPEDFKNVQEHTLTLLTLPAGTAREPIALLEPVDPAQLESDQLFKNLRSAAAVYRPKLAWSPDGRRLAFVAMRDRPLADVYVYSMDTGEIVRLTDEAEPALGPRWSLDGEYILYSHWSGYDDGSDANWYMTSLWAARADGSGAKRLYGEEVGISDAGEHIQGWVGPHTFLVNSSTNDCGEFRLRTFDIETGQVQTIWKDDFRQMVFDPVSRAALVELTEFNVGFCGSPDEPQQPGVFLIPPGETVPRRVHDTGQGNVFAQLHWSSVAGAFFVELSGAVSIVRLDGLTTRLENLSGLPTTSGAGEVWAWTGSQARPGIWVGPIDKPGRQILAKANPQWMGWSPTGGALFFVSTGLLFVARAPDYMPEMVSASLHPTGEVIWVR